MILSDNDEDAYVYQRKFIAQVLQGRGKSRVMLSIYSAAFQAGKGAFFIDFLGKALGKYHYVPTTTLTGDDGLLGRFNANFMGKLLHVLDENAPFVGNKAAHGRLRSWLVAKTVEYKACHHQPVVMNDFANLMGLTNDNRSMRVEKNGDARNAVIAINEAYSLHAAETNVVFEGEPMTIERRLEYFTQLYEAINDPSVAAAFLFEMLAEDCETFDFQGKIPKNEFRADLAEASNDLAWQDEFLDAWESGSAWWREDAIATSDMGDDFTSSEVCKLSTDGPVAGKDLFKAVTAWAKREGSASATSQCYSQPQLGLALRAVIPSRITKTKRNSGMFYQLV